MLEAPKPLSSKKTYSGHWGRQDTQVRIHVQWPGDLAKAPSLSSVGGKRESQSWLSSISAVYVGNGGLKVRPRNQEAWGHWYETLGAELNKARSRPGVVPVG